MLPLRIVRALFAALAVLLALPAAHAQDLSRHFRGINGTFVLLDGRSGAMLRHDARRAAQRFAPCSTFKIPNAAILLETGVARDAEHQLPYDAALGLRNPDWARDLSLREAFRVSALWYFRDMARTAGRDTFPPFLSRFGYGNAKAGSLGTAPFWVDGSLAVSPDEQVQFLQRLFEGRLGLSERTTRLMRDITTAETNSRWTLRAKTGACRAKGQPVSLWYVGSVEKADGTYYFALQMGADAYQPLMDQRIPKARAILTELGILD